MNEALEAYMAPFDSEPEAWADVLRRSQRRHSRRLLFGALIAATVIGIGAAGTALGFHFLAESASPNFRPAAGHAPVAHASQTINTGTWSVTSFTNAAGQTCAGPRVPWPTRSGTMGYVQSTRCFDPKTLFSQSPLFATYGSRQLPSRLDPTADPTRWSNIWVWGLVDTSAVSTVELQLSTCQLIPLQIDAQGFYGYVLGPPTINSDVWPLNVLAYGASGSLVAKQPLDVSPPDTPAAVTPTANAGCAHA